MVAQTSLLSTTGEFEADATLENEATNRAD
jgi:hypothetical protein